MKISILESTSNKILTQREVTWNEIKEILLTHETKYKTKNEVPMFSPCEFEEGKPRSNATAKFLHFGVIDCDDIGKEQLERIKEKLALTSYVCYTSWSHSKQHEYNNQYRVRFVFPFNRPVKKEMWKETWSKLNVFFEGMIDQNCKDPQRGYYLPACINKTDHWTLTNNGLVFNIDKLLSVSESSLKSDRVTQTDLEKLAAKLKRSRSEFFIEFSDVLKRAVNGEPFAQQGDRDNRLFQLANTIAKEFPNCDSKQVADLFHKSFEAMQDQGSRKANRENFISKLERAKEKIQEELKERREQLAEEQRFKIQTAFGPESGRDYPYTEEELNAFAEQAQCSREAFTKRWIIQNENSFYIYFDGDYRGPVGREGFLNYCDKYLAPAITGGVDLYKMTKQGPVPKMRNEILLAYATTTNQTRGTWGSQFSYYDQKEDAFVEALAPLRVTESKYDPEIDTFFRLLGGSEYRSILDFVSVITDLDRPCAALYLHSPPGYGKNLFVNGLSRLWTTRGPTAYAEAIKDFNQDLGRCPLVMADETMPKSFRQNGNSGEWREFIQATSRQINRKYLSSVSLAGSIRLVMAANNQNMLDLKEHLNPNDIDAIVERLCYIECDNPEVKVFLSKMSYEEINSFITQDRIAKHALWLRDNHVVESKNRFILTSKNSEFHRSLLSGQGINSVICHWLVSYLQNPSSFEIGNSTSALIRIRDKTLYVSPKALSDNWDVYDTHIKPPIPSRISTALSGISKSNKSTVLKHRGKNTRYWEIDSEYLVSWAEANAFATRDELEEALSKDTGPKDTDDFYDEVLNKREIA